MPLYSKGTLLTVVVLILIAAAFASLKKTYGPCKNPNAINVRYLQGVSKDERDTLRSKYGVRLYGASNDETLEMWNEPSLFKHTTLWKLRFEKQVERAWYTCNYAIID